MVKLFSGLVALGAVSAGVVQLTSDTFEDQLSGADIGLVKFFAPWCGHCKSMASDWEAAADTFADNEKVVIAEVDCTENRELCGKYEVQGYPTLKSFKKGAAFEEFYDRKKDAIVNYANKHSGGAAAAAAPAASNVKSAAAPDASEYVAGNVWTIVGSNFNELLVDSDKHVFVKIYAPWCGHCRAMAGAWDDLAASLKDDDNVIIAKVDATENDTPSGYQVRGFPTLFYAAPGSKDTPEKYQGARTVEAWTTFLNGKIGGGKDEL